MQTIRTRAALAAALPWAAPAAPPDGAGNKKPGGLSRRRAQLAASHFVIKANGAAAQEKMDYEKYRANSKKVRQSKPNGIRSRSPPAV
jgi:hypothetical protein